MSEWKPAIIGCYTFYISIPRIENRWNNMRLPRLYPSQTPFMGKKSYSVRQVHSSGPSGVVSKIGLQIQKKNKIIPTDYWHALHLCGTRQLLQIFQNDCIIELSSTTLYSHNFREDGGRESVCGCLWTHVRVRVVCGCVSGAACSLWPIGSSSLLGETVWFKMSLLSGGGIQNTNVLSSVCFWSLCWATGPVTYRHRGHEILR